MEFPALNNNANYLSHIGPLRNQDRRHFLSILTFYRLSSRPNHDQKLVYATVNPKPSTKLANKSYGNEQFLFRPCAHPPAKIFGKAVVDLQNHPSQDHNPKP